MCSLLGGAIRPNESSGWQGTDIDRGVFEGERSELWEIQVDVRKRFHRILNLNVPAIETDQLVSLAPGILYEKGN